jgi:recombination protein RecA
MDSQLLSEVSQRMETKRKKVEKLIEKLKEKSPGMHLGFGAAFNTAYIPTPFVTLNNLNNGGIPRGKFGVIAGPAQTAKSTLLAQAIGYNMQNDPDFVALWTDAENSIEPEWMETLGVDLDRLIIQRYTQDQMSMEQLLDSGLELIKTKSIDMWIIDSIGALVPKAEANKMIEDNAMLDVQRKLGQFFRKANTIICSDVEWPGCACVFIGQIYNVPTTTGVGLEEVRGGNALKHWAHWRWKTRRGNRDEGPEEINVRFPDGNAGKIRPGWALHVKEDKSKINEKESQEIILQFVNGRGLDSTNSAITALIANEIIERDGAMYKHEKLPEGKIRGRDNLIKFLQDNKELREELIKEMDVFLAERQLDQGNENQQAE